MNVLNAAELYTEKIIKLVNFVMYILPEFKNIFLKREAVDFPGSTVEKNPLVNSGDTGSIPGPGRFHLLRRS